MDKLNKIIARCKCGFYLTINSHRDDYETVEQYFNSNPINQEYLEDIDKNIYEKMKELNVIISIHFYPDTPIGFYNIYHYDLDMAFDEILKILNLI